MSFIEKKTNKCYLLNIHVKPYAKRQKVHDNIDSLLVSLLSKAEKNKANKELISFLKNKLKIPSNQIKIIYGLKSSKKSVQLDFNEEITLKEIYDKIFC